MVTLLYLQSSIASKWFGKICYSLTMVDFARHDGILNLDNDFRSFSFFSSPERNITLRLYADGTRVSGWNGVLEYTSTHALLLWRQNPVFFSWEGDGLQVLAHHGTVLTADYCMVTTHFRLRHQNTRTKKHSRHECDPFSTVHTRLENAL